MVRKTASDNELFANGSSLVLAIEKDDSHDFKAMIYDRRSNRIITQIDTALVTLRSFMNLSPIDQRKRTRLTHEDIQCINFLMDFWETKHRETCKNEKVFKKFRRLRVK